MERYVWTSHPYVAYTMVDKLFNPLTLLVGPCLVAYLMFKSTLPVAAGGYHLPWWNILLSYMVWLSATRTLKLMPHLWHRPGHIIYVPAFILFGYYFAIMKIYALCTLHETGWGTRAGIGDASAATAALDDQDQMDEKNNAANNPYTHRQQYSAGSNANDASPFMDQPSPYSPQPSPYRDDPTMPNTAVPVYASRHTGRKASVSQRRRPAEDDGVEMQVGYAR
jgi:hypothetical protein